ncbi:MAG TPA: TetR/AcrR family transcriptional regulator [Spirochaetota bacterium]|nr:TetR/AcrR family transcriptional regulator [Spirochaetota bacterium]HNT12695.1 TetR/AcrR family transcriptional regulator [Spirochaetota bacterium]HNV48791.1 TetR/AcrR family transcriptional regulator [Spirochaetota bacterium]HPU87329.1 TetR/AcrR family transcriptional regulator [Spirochaetota bacterium]
MPPRISFSKEEIIQAAIDVVRADGPNSASARSIAKRMGGSTQPIYRAFETIEDLGRELVAAAEEIAIRHMLEYQYGEWHFLSMGLGFLEFAIREPELYRLLYLSGKNKFQFQHDRPPYDRLFEKMKRDAALAELDDAARVRLFRDMAIYSHGLCGAALMRPGGFTVEEYRPLLMEMGMRLIVFEVLRRRGTLTDAAIRTCLHETAHPIAREILSPSATS